MIHDPLADAQEAHHEYGLTLSPLEAFQDLDGLILAVPHRAYLAAGSDSLARRLASSGVLIDVKSALSPSVVGATQAYWSL